MDNSVIVAQHFIAPCSYPLKNCSKAFDKTGSEKLWIGTWSTKLPEVALESLYCLLGLTGKLNI